MIHSSNGQQGKALEYYYQALERNPRLSQALNNIAIIYHYRAQQALLNNQDEVSKVFFDKAIDYWKEAVRLSPNSYPKVQNWLSMRRLFSS